MKIILLLLTVSLVSITGIEFGLISILKKEIKESRTREDLLYKEVKQLDYEISVLTDLQKDMK